MFGPKEVELDLGKENGVCSKPEWPTYESKVEQRLLVNDLRSGWGCWLWRVERKQQLMVKVDTAGFSYIHYRRFLRSIQGQDPGLLCSGFRWETCSLSMMDGGTGQEPKTAVSAHLQVDIGWYVGFVILTNLKIDATVANSWSMWLQDVGAVPMIVLPLICCHGL